MARERKTTGKQTFPRESFGWEREIRISTETIWMGMGYRDFFGDWLGATTGTIFAREREIIPIPVKSCGNFAAGILPRDALRINAPFTLDVK